MKRYFPFALVCALLFTASCGAPDLLDYQRYPIFADCLLSYDEGNLPDVRFSCEIADRDSARLIFTDGELAGFAVTVTRAGVSLTDGQGFTVPLECTGSAPVRAVVSAFALDPEKVESAPESSEIRTVDGSVTVVLGNGIPKKLIFDGFTVTVTGFSNK